MYKIRVEAMILRNPHLVIRNAEDLVLLYHKYADNESEIYQFCVVETMAAFERETKEERAFIRIPSLMKQHEIHYFEGGLIAKEVPCMRCAQVDGLCQTCRFNLKYTVTPEKVKKALIGWRDPTCLPDHQDMLDVEGMGDEEDILVQSDDEGEAHDGERNGGEEHALEEFPEGAIVWGLRYHCHIYF